MNRMPHFRRRAVRKTGPARAFASLDRPRHRQPQSALGRLAVILGHLVPGVAAYWLLRSARETLERWGLSSAEAQIGVIMTGVMLSMGVATFVLTRQFDGLGLRDTLRLTGLARFDAVAILHAVGLWALVLAVPRVLGYEDDLRSLVESAGWLALPSWHFQLIDGFRRLSVPVGALAITANLICEELWFRGYLQDKLGFLGRSSWIAAGLLFTLYHVFEASIVYPNFLGGLALAGLWGIRRDLWACILLHALLNASG